MLNLAFIAAGALLQRIAVPALTLGLAGALLLAGGQYVRAVRAEGRVQAEVAKLAKYQAAQELQARLALQTAAQEKARTDKLRQEAIDAEHLARVAAQADADRLRGTAGQLQRYAADLASSLGDRARDPAAAGGSASAQAAGDLLAQLSGRIDDAAEGIALYAADANRAGTLCERAYDALRPVQ